MSAHLVAIVAGAILIGIAGCLIGFFFLHDKNKIRDFFFNLLLSLLSAGVLLLFIYAPIYFFQEQGNKELLEKSETNSLKTVLDAKLKDKDIVSAVTNLIDKQIIYFEYNRSFEFEHDYSLPDSVARSNEKPSICLFGYSTTSFIIQNISSDKIQFPFRVFYTDLPEECQRLKLQKVVIKREGVEDIVIKRDEKPPLGFNPLEQCLQPFPPDSKSTMCCTMEIPIESGKKINIIVDENVSVGVKDFFAQMMRYPTSLVTLEIKLPKDILINSFIVRHPAMEMSEEEHKKWFYFTGKDTNTGKLHYLKGVLPFQAVELGWHPMPSQDILEKEISKYIDDSRWVWKSDICESQVKVALSELQIENRESRDINSAITKVKVKGIVTSKFMREDSNCGVHKSLPEGSLIYSKMEFLFQRNRDGWKLLYGPVSLTGEKTIEFKDPDIVFPDSSDKKKEKTNSKIFIK